MNCKAVTSTHVRFLPWHADFLLCLQEECQLCIFPALQECIISEISKQGFLTQWLHCGLDHPNSTLGVTLDSSLSTSSSEVQLKLCSNYISALVFPSRCPLYHPNRLYTLHVSKKETVRDNKSPDKDSGSRIQGCGPHSTKTVICLVTLSPHCYSQQSRNPLWESNYPTVRKADARAVNNNQVLQDSIQARRDDACECRKGYGSPGALVMHTAMNWVSTETPS